jgi:hypothetical protein
MDVNNARIQQYRVHWFPRNSGISAQPLGIHATGAEMNYKGEYVNLEDVDQFFGRVASQKVGFGVMFRVRFYEVAPAEIAKILIYQVRAVVDGVKKALHGDTTPVNMNKDVAGQLTLIPLNAPANDLSEAQTLWKAAPQVDIKFASDRTKYQSVDVEFIGYPDPLRTNSDFPFSNGYFCIGDPTAVETDPDALGFVFGDEPKAPYVHNPSAGMYIGDQKRFTIYGAWRQAGTNFVLVNNGAGIAANATTIPYDNKQEAVDLTGYYLINGTSAWYVTADSGGTSASGNLTVVPRSLYSVAAAKADNDQLDVVDPASLAILPMTDSSTMASSAPLVASIGDFVSDGSKARATALTAGVTNLTAQKGATISDNLVLTVTA